MGKINVLDEQLANQIAAGEVVERPSSVVKELVENAIDAGSTTIDIAIEEGGLTLVRVTDNGTGIDADDMEKAFFRHATSKLASSKDLFRIASLGFRGEALPSIAAVAKVECVSATEPTGLGKRLIIEGGTVKKLEDANTPQGTDIAVRDLFFNTPARLKYMKSIQTEIGHIADYVNRLALAHPGIAFTLKHNGNSLLRTLGTGDRLQAFAAVYGTTTAKSMLIVEGEHPDYDLHGYISRPDLTRANRNGITIVVNGRYIKSFVINQAILQAYHTLLPINRFPMIVLDLVMHPSLLDVNVHPSKMEVRFSKEPELKQFVEETLAKALGRERHIPGPAEKPERSKPLFVQDRMSFYQPEPTTVQQPEKTTGIGNSAVGNLEASGSNTERRTAVFEQPVSRQPYDYGRETGSRNSSSNSSSLFGGGSVSNADFGSRNEPNWSAAGRPVTRPALPKDMTERLYAPPSDASPRVETSFVKESAPVFSPSTSNSLSFSSSSAVASSAVKQSDDRVRLNGLEDWADDYAEPAPSHSNAPESAAEEAVNPSSAELSGSLAAPRSAVEVDKQAPVDEQAHAEQQLHSDKQAFPELYWIGQLHGTYIVAQNEEGLFLIDQHAAHERINYEYYFEKFGRPQQASQQLIVPMTLELTQAEAASLTSKLELLAKAGVELEPFGTNTFLVRSHPEWLPRGEEQALIEEMIEWLLNERGQVDIGKLREKSAIMCSCKASIKANDRLTREEGEGLLRRLAACMQPYTCPHGRPIVVHMTTYQLEKMFKRVMS